MTYCIRLGILGAVLGATLGGCDAPDDGTNDDDGMVAEQGLEPGTYLLTPENRDFRFELREDGTFSTFGLEADLNLSSRGIWAVEDGMTVLRPESEDPMGDGVRDDLCPTRCFQWSTVDGFTQVVRVDLEVTADPEVVEASLYDRVEEKDVTQTFTLADPDTPLPGI